MYLIFLLMCFDLCTLPRKCSFERNGRDVINYNIHFSRHLPTPYKHHTMTSRWPAAIIGNITEPPSFELEPPAIQENKTL